MKKDPLIAIIGDGLRAKLIRLFVMDMKTVYSSAELRIGLKANASQIRSALSSLVKDEVLVSAKGKERVEKQLIVNGKRKMKTVSVDFNGYKFNAKCPFRSIVEELVFHTVPTEKDVLVRKLSKLPRVKVLLTTGVFAKNEDSPADILIVGNDVDESAAKEIIREAENFLGRELRFAVFETNEFLHRLNINDVLIRNILDSKHFIYKDDLGISR